jgi:hypothetical protein
MTPTPFPRLTTALARSLVRWGIVHGLIHFRPAEVDKFRPTDNRQRLRNEFKKRGLSSAGTPYKVHFHPELKGLNHKEYQRQYMRLKRAGKI